MQVCLNHLNVVISWMPPQEGCPLCQAQQQIRMLKRRWWRLVDRLTERAKPERRDEMPTDKNALSDASEPRSC